MNAANPNQTNAVFFAHADSFENSFEFRSYSEFLSLSCDRPNEFAINIVDGTDAEISLAVATRLNQNNIEDFLKILAENDESSFPALFFLINQKGYSLENANRMVFEANIVQSRLRDAAEDLFYEIYCPPEGIAWYIDFDSFANDCKLGGDLVEFEFNGRTYTCTNASSL